MFTGVGGFELGLQGATCVGMSEIDKYANELLSKRFLGIKNYGDCTKIKPDELPDFDMLCGGFPCQAFSIAGKRRGFEDTRGTMFFEISRILKIKRPKIILLENVKGLLNHEKGETFRVILQTLDELGYEVQWMVLNSKFFGVPQNRERVFIIGNLRGERRPEILPFRQNADSFTQKGENGTSRTLVSTYYKGGKEPLISYARRDKAQHSRIYKTDGISPTLAGASKLSGDCTPKIVQRYPLRFLNRNQRNIKGDYSFTVDSSNTGGILEDMKTRKLTPVECERLQGFPDGWTEGFSDTQRYKMMGNAVTVNVIKAIGNKL